MAVTVLRGDCVEIMADLDADSVETIVTDPPWAFSFMGRAWDSFASPEQYQKWTQGWAEQALRVLKPGGHMLVCCGTRTYHRMACGVEDAGFQVRDVVVHLYRSGFPKSKNVGSGQGTALKPAIEPWVLARKPLSERTVAANVRRWGTGALNIDGCRIGRPEGDRIEYGRHNILEHHGSVAMGRFTEVTPYNPHEKGRWPANCVTLEDDEDLRHFRTTIGPVADFPKAPAAEKPWTGASNAWDKRCTECGGQVRTPGRNCRECTCDTPVWRAERTEEAHPTVKPLALMRWLIRLVTPPDGLVLDPFAGTGTTGEAAIAENRRVVLIEKDAGYADLIERRLGKPIQAGLGL